MPIPLHNALAIEARYANLDPSRRASYLAALVAQGFNLGDLQELLAQPRARAKIREASMRRTAIADDVLDGEGITSIDWRPE